MAAAAVGVLDGVVAAALAAQWRFGVLFAWMAGATAATHARACRENPVRRRPTW